MSEHAKISPSGFHRLVLCPGSQRLEADLPNTSSVYAQEGTAAHELAAKALESGLPANAYLGQMIVIEGKQFPVNTEMVENVQQYIDAVNKYKGNGHMLVERRVDFGGSVVAEDCWGTSDVVVIQHDEYQVHDLKYGRGLKVEATDNEQLALYALGCLDEFGTLGIERVRMVIHQPRLSHVSEWVATVAELTQFAKKAKRAIEIAAAHDAPLIPGTKQCRFCKAASTCPAIRDEVIAEFDLLPTPMSASSAELARARDKVEMISAWCAAVTQETERRVLSGDHVPGYKAVLSRRGIRKWTDPALATQMLKAMRLRDTEIFDSTLISPATAEKLLKTQTIGPRQWNSLQPLIAQSEPKPIVVPNADERPELSVTSLVHEFEVISE
jgi:hypothetical protein